MALLLAGILLGLALMFLLMPSLGAWMLRNGLFSTGIRVTTDPHRKSEARAASERTFGAQIRVLRRLRPLAAVCVAAAVVLLVV